MKSREAFERIRRQKNDRLSLRVRLTLLVSVEITFAVLIAVGLWSLADRYFRTDSTLLLLLHLLIFSLIIGSVVTGFMSKWFFDPIKKLRRAMERVADGDFSTRLESKTSSKEIGEIYSGFNLMTHELASTEILQTDFISNVSHEFKTPINAIEGYATLLQGTSTEQERRQYVDKILFNTRRLSDLVGNILLLSKIENQSIEKNHTLYRLDEQIRGSVVALEGAWFPRDIEFDVEMQRIEYLGNEPLMRHVWDNLIGNAIKFGPAGGTVRLRLWQQGERIFFTVEDEGDGIDEENIKHIFDKFYQADSSKSQEGNGLGLALCKRIVSVAGGSITVMNRPEGGAKFIVELEKKGITE